MPWTIYCPKTDRLPALCYGVFDTDTLAKRHASRALRDRTINVVRINEPLQPENYLSLERLRNACNFALTVLRDVDKARKESYLKKCVDEIEDAIMDRPNESIKLYRYKIEWDGTTHTSIAVNEETAMRQLACFPEEYIEDWHRRFVIVNLGEVT